MRTRGVWDGKVIAMSLADRMEGILITGAPHHAQHRRQQPARVWPQEAGRIEVTHQEVR